ncbi:hypothetical protein [Burkholderia glumae]|uniref:hypothetical protein n=1 Tax=Burkholderia glumae TaxID=337 RepID=UPI002150AC5A|nr:hypothetical protein [Burkholderia glumae]
MKFNPDYLLPIALICGFCGFYVFFVKTLFHDAPRGYIKIMWAFLTVLMSTMGIALIAGCNPINILFVCPFAIATALALMIFFGLRRQDISWHDRDVSKFLDDMHRENMERQRKQVRWSYTNPASPINRR